ncbi:alpha-ketoacid dehydrogenase kinase [Conidiobolus coronatus NRRL 28638]|uniref:Protein-serine/threonine kinase n=1 Tax=Conidiobolus coronatus (strain ATCC 28846 / CBS 209.66 / NRRL 28638) TaxID=796925 RepID=A0A137P3H7_CONC2|nr:alpha-ketoacid dehydrogenase kinase [Conidiobolus coronatus NRRL 28638]|eukprot:KXN69548.1 alpha-ketoacid dehydrogenase kinase [Conidiobolus coronatus NRRL 28638]
MTIRLPIANKRAFHRIYQKYLSSKTLNFQSENSTRVVSFYDEKIDNFANQPIRPVTLEKLLQFGTPPLTQSQLLSSARYTQTELPQRLARRVQQFQKLPYIVGINPHLSSVYHLYYNSFEAISSFPRIETENQLNDFREMIDNLVKSHAGVIPSLAQGFLECQKYISEDSIASFLDDMIRSRIGIRLIAEQHLALHMEQPNWVGVIQKNLCPKTLFTTTAKTVDQICQINYGATPSIIFNGYDDCTFHYVPVHLEYIACELLKNAYRATVEFANKHKIENYPPIELTISADSGLLGIRIRDRGGGMPSSNLKDIFKYSYTTETQKSNHGCKPFVQRSCSSDTMGSIFDLQAILNMQACIGGPMAGLGYGLPMTKLYVEYFGGQFHLQTIDGYGTDAFLVLKSIDEQAYQTQI